MNITRTAINPLITPADVTPTTPDMMVLSAFNAAAARYGAETMLLMRVAETVRDVAPDEVAVPVLEYDSGEPRVRVERIPRNTPGLDLTDSRAFVLNDRFLLSSLSHLRLARSTDGIHFTIEEAPALFPQEPYEEYGMEDPRITEIDGTYYISYTAVSRWGIAVGLASTTDFKTYHRHGLMFGPENKNVAIFPERINGKYIAMHRPATPTSAGNQEIWLSSSPDLFHWGSHCPLISKRPGMWDSIRIGAGSVPHRINEGWLVIYHGVNREQGYCLGAMLLDHDDPRRVLARSAEPILYPKEAYECVGFYGNVVFTCGTVLDDDGTLRIYYGAADEHTCCASVHVDDILDLLLRTPESGSGHTPIGIPVDSLLVS
ncbi:MAG: glycoside hydrolase family 130 protein [Armatimonadota bacterium]